MSARTHEDAAVGTAESRPSLAELRRRVIDVAVGLDAARGGLVAILDELPSTRPMEEAVDELGPRTGEDDLVGVLEDLLPDLTEAVSRLRAAGERTEADLEADRRREAQALVAADTWIQYRQMARESRTIAATAEAICAGLVQQRPPSGDAVAAVERGVESLAALLRAAPVAAQGAAS